MSELKRLKASETQLIEQRRRLESELDIARDDLEVAKRHLAVLTADLRGRATAEGDDAAPVRKPIYTTIDSMLAFSWVQSQHARDHYLHLVNRTQGDLHLAFRFVRSSRGDDDFRFSMPLGGAYSRFFEPEDILEIRVSDNRGHVFSRMLTVPAQAEK